MPIQAKLDKTDGGIILSDMDDHTISLHPLWLRERTEGPADFDPNNNQRLYEVAEFPLDLKVQDCALRGSDNLSLKFSDGYQADISLNPGRQHSIRGHN